MIRVALKSLLAAGIGAAMISSAPASAMSVWIYYGGAGEVIGYKVANDDGTLCVQYGYESSSVDYTYQPGDAC